MEAEEVRNSGFSAFIQRDTNYRTTALVNSDESSDSSDNENIWSSKRSKMPEPETLLINKPFVNPNNPSENTVQGPCSPIKKVRKNNIWGSILQEQSVSEGISRKIQVNSDSDIDSDNVESYNYKTKFKDTRSEVNNDSEEMDEKPHCNASFVDKETFGNEDNKGRKRVHSSRKGVKDRLGKGALKERIGERSYDKNKERPHITVTATDSTAKIVNELVNVLNEPKVELMTRVVETIGPQKSLQLLYMTEDVEEAGGMMINNGSRRRTPGGVFLQLLRTDADIERPKVNIIFKDEKDEYKRKEKRKRRRQQQWIDRQVSKTMAECPMEEGKIHEPESNEKEKNKEQGMVTDIISQISDPQDNGDIKTVKENNSELEEGEISD